MSSHVISFHLFIFITLGFGANQHAYAPRSALKHPLTSAPQCNYSSTQRPDTSIKQPIEIPGNSGDGILAS